MAKEARKLTRRLPVIEPETWQAVAGLSLVTLIVCFVLLPRFWFPARNREDVQAATLKHAGAVVTSVYYRPVLRGRTNPPRRVSLRVNDRTASNAAFVQVDTYEPVRVGQSVRAIYRIGQSGKIHVERIEPLPASKKAP